jgi:hypothetical protein
MLTFFLSSSLCSVHTFYLLCLQMVCLFIYLFFIFQAIGFNFFPRSFRPRPRTEQKRSGPVLDQMS